MSETEIAWAAGFFDGEGSVGVSGRKPPRWFLQVSQSWENREVLERFAGIVGIGRVRGPYHPPSIKAKGGRPFGIVGVQNKSEVDRIMAILWPYLGSEKKEDLLRARMVHEHYVPSRVWLHGIMAAGES